MISLFLTLLILLSGSLLGAVQFHRRFEEIIPITCIGIVLILFLFGLLDHLLWGVYAVIAAAVGIYGYVAFLCLRKEHRASLARNLFTPGLLIFLGCFCFYLLGDFNLRATVTDEFSHWMYCVKTTTYLDDLSTNPAAYSSFPSYPPGMCLFQYFFQKIYLLAKPGMPFSEWRAYFAYQLLLVSMAMPFLRQLSVKRPLELLLSAAIPVFIHLPFFFPWNFTGVMIDAFVGAAAGYTFAMVLLGNDCDPLTPAYLCLYCAMLVLSKDVGLFFACFAAIAYLIRRLWGLKNRREVLVMGLPLIASLLAKLLWKLEVDFSGCVVRFHNKIDFLHYTKMFFLGGDSTFRQTAVDRYKDAFSTFRILYNPIPVTYFAAFCVVTLMLALLVWGLIRQGSPKRATISTAVLLLLSLCVYIYSMGATYVYNFGESEALELASYDRYLRMAFVSVWIVLWLSLCQLISHMASLRRATLCAAAGLAVLLAVTPISDALLFITRDDVEQSFARRGQFIPLTERIEDTCDPGDRVYLVCQEYVEDAALIMRFNVYPAKLNASPFGVCFEPTGMDTGGVSDRAVSADSWWDCLDADYDYVAILNADDYFVDTFGVLFEDPSQIGANTLFRVDHEKGLLVICDPA